MGKKKRQFINKKTAATFQIVQRRQDGDYEGETVTGSKYMLQPARYDTPLPADFPMDLLQVPAHATDLRKVVDKHQGKDEDDSEGGDEDYDYEQHFRSIGELGPDSSSAVFIQNPSAPTLDIRQKVVAVEAKDEDLGERLFTQPVKPERTGKLKITGDLAKALEGVEGFDELDDDFVLAAVREQKFDVENEEDYDEGDLFGDEGDEVDAEEDEGDFEDEGDEGDDQVVVHQPTKLPSKKHELTRKPLTHPTSSKVSLKPTKDAEDDFSDEGDEFEGDDEGDEVVKEDETEVNGRPKRMIDSQFDSLLAQYDDDEDIGELDPDNPELLGGVENLDDYAKEISEFTSERDREYGGDQATPLSSSEKKDIIAKLEVQAADEDEPIAITHAKIDAMFAVTEKENWDCESIVSTYSNTENHPLLIKRPSKTTKPIKLSGKTGIPIGYFPTHGKPEAVIEEEEEEEEGDEEEASRGNLGVARNKEETKAEKKARKKEVKAARREARGRKKDLKLQYSAELNRQLQFDHHQQLHNPPVTKL